MGTVIWREIRAHLKRFVLTALAVTLGVAFLSGTLGIRDVLRSTFSSLIDGLVTDGLLVSGPVVAETGFGALHGPIDPALAETIESVAGVTRAEPEYSGQLIILGADGNPANFSQARAVGIPYSETASTLYDGRAPENAQEIAIEESTAVRAGLATGDTVTVVLNGDVQELTVTGLVRYETPMAGASVGMLEAEHATEVFASDGGAESIRVELADGVSEAAAMTAVSQAIGGDHVVRSAAEVRAEEKDAFEGLLTIINTLITVFVAIALAIGTFIIANTFHMSVRQRQRQFALLRAIGAAPGNVFAIVICQAIVIGLVGSALGLLLGQGLLIAIRSGIESLGMPLVGDFTLAPATALLSLAIGVVVTVISAAIPARQAALTPPLEAMRETSGASEPPLKRRTIIGAVALAAGVPLVVASALGNLPGWALGGGAALTVLAVFLLAPALIAPAVLVLGAPLRRLNDVPATLASRALRASARKTATTAAALIVGVALVAGGATLATSIKSSLASAYDEIADFDLLMQPITTMDDAPQALERIAANDGVDAILGSVRLGYAMVSGSGGPVDGQVAAIDPAVTGPLGVTAVAGSLADFAAGSVIVGEDLANDQGWSVGEVLTIAGQGEALQAPIVAIVATEMMVVPVGLTSGDFAALNPAFPTLGSTLIDVADGADIAAVKAQLTAELKDLHLYRIMDREDMVDAGSAAIDTALTFLYALLGLSIVIAILGVINTLSLSVADRVREIGLLQAVGVSRGSIRALLLHESVLTTLIGSILGIALGVPLAIAVYAFMSDGGTLSISIPWASLGLLVAAAIVVGVLASVIPGHRAARIDIVDAIHAD